MNQIFGLKHYDHKEERKLRAEPTKTILRGKIRGTTVDYFKIIQESNNHYQLIARDSRPSYPRQWYVKCAGTYDYCLGVLHGRYDHSSKSVDWSAIEIEEDNTDDQGRPIPSHPRTHQRRHRDPV